MLPLRKIVGTLVTKALDHTPAAESQTRVHVDRVVVEVAAGRTFWLAFALGAAFGEGTRELIPLILTP